MRKFSALPFLFFAVQMLAQSKENERFVLGFFAGLETQSLGVQPLGSHRPEDLWAAAGNPKIGASVGVFAQKPIWRWLHFQPELAVSYFENQVFFWPDGHKPYRFLDAELPLHFVVSDWRKETPLRACVIFGGRMSWNFAQNPSNLLKVSQERFGLDLGLGAEIKVKRWRLQPAFVYSHGMNDLHFLDQAKYDDVVGKVVRDKLSIRLLVWKLRK